MYGFILLTVLIVAAFFQTTVLDFISITGIKPDLVLIMIVFIAIQRGQVEGVFWGIVSGMIKDTITGGYFGLNVLTYLLAGYLAGLSNTVFIKDSPVTISFISLFVSLCSGVVHYLLLLYLGIYVSIGVALLKIVFCGAVYNTVVALFLYKYFYRSLIKDILWGNYRGI